MIATLIGPTNAHVATLAKLNECEARVRRVVRAYEAVVPPPERTIVLHLLLHIPRQQYWWGPAWTHWMFPFERMVGELKRLHSHRLHPEASVMRNWQVGQFSLVIPQRYPALRLAVRPSATSGSDSSSEGDEESKDNNERIARPLLALRQWVAPYNRWLPTVTLAPRALKLIAQVCGFAPHPRMGVTRRYIVDGVRRGGEYDANTGRSRYNARCGVQIDMSQVADLITAAGITVYPGETHRYARIQYVAYARDASDSKSAHQPQRVPIAAVHLFDLAKTDGRAVTVQSRDRFTAFVPLTCLGRMVGFGPSDDDTAFHIFSLK